MHHSGPNPETPTQSADQTSAPTAPQFSIIRILVSVLTIAAIGGGGYFLWDLQSAPPALVAFTGRVLYNGQPVRTGGVLTEHSNTSLMGAVGALNENGEFTLMTNNEPGAYVGQHKLAVSAMSGGSPPVPIVPGRYTQPGSTPLRLTVSADPAANHAEFILEDGEVPPAQAPENAGAAGNAAATQQTPPTLPPRDKGPQGLP